MYEYLLIRFFNVTQFIVKRNSSGGKGEGNLFQVTHIWFCFRDELRVHHPEEVNLKSQCPRCWVLVLFCAIQTNLKQSCCQLKHSSNLCLSLSLSLNTINFKCANVVRRHQLNPVCDVLDLQQQISFCCVFFLNTCRENTLWMQVI